MIGALGLLVLIGMTVAKCMHSVYALDHRRFPVVASLLLLAGLLRLATGLNAFANTPLL